MPTGLSPILIVLAIIAVTWILVRLRKGAPLIESEKRRAGRQGEQIAADYIRSVLREGDELFTNVKFTFEGRPAELDSVVVNKNGVFIFEVKNYVGRLFGGEDDYEWYKEKTTGAGNTYGKSVKNPIKQVKRQIYLLAHHLEKHGIDVWVEGYAILLAGNSPVQSDTVITDRAQLDSVLHAATGNHLSSRELDRIRGLLGK